MKIVLSNELVESLDATLNSFLDFGINNKLELFRFGQARSGGVCTGWAEVDFVVCERSQDEFVHAEGGCSIHTRMFTEETRYTVIVNNNCRIISTVS